MRSPRSSRIAAGGNCRRSVPSNRISPPAIRPGGCGTSPMIDSAVTLLPQPDSPTMPSVRPASSDRLMPSTAGNSPPPSTANQVLRFADLEQAHALGHRWPARRRGGVEALDFRLDLRPIGHARRPRARGQAGDEGLVALEALDVQPQQFGQRFGVIVDAQVEKRVCLGGADQQRRRLLAALVAARGLAGLHRRDQSFGEGQIAARVVGLRRILDHLGAGQHVARDRKAVAGDLPAPLDALRRRCARRCCPRRR